MDASGKLPARDGRAGDAMVFARNFRSMPGGLKLLTVNALSCVVFVPMGLLFARFPPPSLEGRLVFAWWRSDLFPIATSITGLLMAIAGVLFLKRRGLGRAVYLGGCAIAFVSGWSFQRDVVTAALAALLAGALGAYLFRDNAVRNYFGEPQLPTAAGTETLRAFFAGNIIPIVSLVSIALTALHFWTIAGDPRMADGLLSEAEMRPIEKSLVMVVVFSVLGTMAVALRRAYRARSWIWFVACLAWPLSYAYTLLVNRDGRR